MSSAPFNIKKNEIPKGFQRAIPEFVENNQESPYYNYRSRKRLLNRHYKTIIDVPHPFVKWAGGKRQLLKQFDKYLPYNYKQYIEPFVGGGTIFFYLLPENAILIDINEELINCYRVIRDKVDALIELLQHHRNEKNYFYQIRNVDRFPEIFKQWSDVERASRTIYLNRCCFNGLYRVNNRGQFNVPFGKYTNPKFCDEENLRAVHNVLQNVEILHADFMKCLDFADEGDFIYLDPPYQPLSETANFTSYTKEGFDEEAQLKLFDVFSTLNERGCKVLLSNSYTKFILELYKNFKIVTVQAKRAINSDATKRGNIKEALIMNF
ncbi:MAG: DNA adenine methylase [Candidatus Helarchaeota archaeon]